MDKQKITLDDVIFNCQNDLYNNVRSIGTDVKEIYNSISYDETIILIKLLLKGGKKSLFYKNSYDLGGLITQKYLLPNDIIESIMDCCNCPGYIYKQIELGYVPNEKLIIDIINYSYDWKHLVKLELSDDAKKNMLLRCVNAYYDNKITIKSLKLKNIKTEHFELIFKINDESYHTNNNFELLLIELIENGYVIDKEFILKFLETKLIFPIYSNTIDQIKNLFVENKIESLENFNFGLNTFNIDNRINLINLIIKFGEEYNLKSCSKIYKKIAVKRNLYETEKNNYNALLDTLIKSKNYIPEVKDLEYACLVNDIYQFNKLLEKLNIFTQECLINACANGSSLIINKLYNMKGIPCEKCAKALKDNDNTTANLLLDNSLELSLNVLRIFLSKGIIIEGLNNYGIKYDLDLYRICHEVQLFPTGYVTEFAKNENINYDLRILIKTSGNNQEKLIEKIEKLNYADDMMYDDAVVARYEWLVRYLENKYNFKPNYKTLIKIPIYKDRLVYLEKIQK